jgi:hypothetical protein
MALYNGDALDFAQITSGSVVARLTSTALYRDPAAWYHVVLVWDSANATAANRMLMYVNGVQVTSFSTNTNPSASLACSFNQAGTNVIGYRNYASDNYFDGYLAEQNFIDGQQLTPNSFGTFNSYGVWQPITYGGSYGTNGFYLPFSNKTSTTTLGYDFSPNGNNWTTNNFSLTTGPSYDSMTDVPTLTSATAANYAVINPLNNPSTYVSYLQANLTVINTTAASHADFMASMGIAPNTGKYYWEVNTQGDGSTRNGTGIGTAASMSSASNPWGLVAGQAGFYIGGSGLIYFENQGTANVFTVSWTTGNMIMYAYDSATGNFWAGQNNVWYSSTGATTGNPSTGANPTLTLSNTSTWFPGGSVYNAGVSSYLNHNFGQQPFLYTPPTGYVALNTYNL